MDTSVSFGGLAKLAKGAELPGEGVLLFRSVVYGSIHTRRRRTRNRNGGVNVSGTRDDITETSCVWSFLSY